MPAHAVAQVEGPGELVVADLPGLRQRGAHLQVLVGLDQGVENVLQHLEREVGTRSVRVELIGFPAMAAMRLPDDSSPRSTRLPVEQAAEQAASTNTRTAANAFIAGRVVTITPGSPRAIRRTFTRWGRHGGRPEVYRPIPVTTLMKTAILTHCDVQAHGHCSRPVLVGRNRTQPGVATPAQADPLMLGVYTYTQEGGRTDTWGVWPSCVPTVGDLREPLELAVACRLHVETQRVSVGGDARLVGGQWTYSTCHQGGHPVRRRQLGVDHRDLQVRRHRAERHPQRVQQRGVRRHPRSGDPYLPVHAGLQGAAEDARSSLYPLDCEPGGLRWCT